MITDLNSKIRLLGAAAITALFAGGAFADTAVSDTSRAAEDEGAVQTPGDQGESEIIESGVNEEAEEAISDSSRAASDDGAVQTAGDEAEEGVITDTATGAAQGPKVPDDAND
ncbi:hypothetical protein ACUXV3_14390 [Roseobacteraceae bacterium NS-SX3]